MRHAKNRAGLSRVALAWALLLGLPRLQAFVELYKERIISPDRGVTVGRAYQLDGIESVNMSNGGLTLRIPLAKLPAGPAGSPSVSLVYNSKYWEDQVVDLHIPISLTKTHVLKASPAGGWRLKYSYELDKRMLIDEQTLADPCNGEVLSGPFFELVLTEPDGSEHKLYTDYAMPSGCESGGIYRSSDFPSLGPEIWYSLDGSFLRVEIDRTSSNWPDGGWTVREPDGSRVVQQSDSTGRTTVRHDKNGNTITWRHATYTGTDCPSGCGEDIVEDEFQHRIEIIDFITRKEVRQKGADGADLASKIYYSSLDFSSVSYYNSNAGPGQRTAVAFVSSQVPHAVTGLDLPARLTPSGTSYTPQFLFQHNGRYKELSRITMPSGAYADYSWALDAGGNVDYFHKIQANSLTQKRVTHDALEDITVYSFATSSTGSITGSSVTRPDGGTTSYEPLEPVDYHLGQGAHAGLIKQLTRPDGSVLFRNWADNAPARSVNNPQQGVNPYVSWEYETAVSASGAPLLFKTTARTVDQNGIERSTEERDWTDWPSSPPPTTYNVGTLLRKTELVPKAPAPDLGAAANGNLYVRTTAPAAWNLIANRRTRNAADALLDERRYQYSSVGDLEHESLWDARGTGSWSTTDYTRDAKGRVTSVRDADGVGADYVYSSCSQFSLYSEARTGIGTTTYGYDNCAAMALPSTRVGPNGRSDSFAYDALGRLTQVDLGSDQRTRYVYDDQNLWLLTREDRVSYADGAGASVVYEDQLGRVKKTRTLESVPTSDTVAADASGAAVVVDTAYTTGTTKVAVRVSNPYRSSGTPATPEAEKGWSVTLSDRMGRVCAVESFSGASTPAVGTCTTAGTSHGGRSEMSYDAGLYGTAGAQVRGRRTTETVLGTPSQVRQRISDGLGRLIRVVEDPSGSNYTTDYGYNAAGRLLSVAQGTRTRSFTYATTGWLLSASNPESGTLSYDYTAGGRLLWRLDGRSVRTCMGTLVGSTCTASLDAAGRPLVKNYSSDASATVTYTYSGERLTGVTNTAATVGYGYDALDRVTSRTQNLGAQGSFVTTATYRPAGLATQTYPGGRVVSYGVDAVGRVASVSGVKSGTPTSYVSAISYAAHGGMSSLAFGNTQTETRSWNHRLQMVGVQRGTAFGLSYKYCSDDSDVCTTNNGNVMKQTISHAGNAAQVYTYDAVGRLASAVEGTNWNRYYGADRWGNQWVTTGSPSPDAFTPGSAANFEPDNRLHLQSAAYDGAGNQTQIGGYASTYDGEGRLATSTLNSVRTTQSYDGEGRRVKKATGTRTTLFSYGVNGELLEDYDTQLPSVSSTEYLAQDPLGSTRATFTTAGTAVKCSDYMPFGEELPANTGAGRSGTCWAASAEPKVKFTGKERDTETGLDYFGARYYSGAQGRFTSPDKPFADQKVSDPQSWNLYSYARNNPLRFVDLDGEAVIESRRIQTYIVQGRTASEAFTNARQVSGFKSDSGETMSGLTKYRMAITNMRVQDSLQPGNQLVDSFAASELVGADVKLDQTIVVPEWAGRAEATLDQQAFWDAGLAGLKQHEEQHATISRQQAEKLDQSLPGTRGLGQASAPGDAQRKARSDLSSKVQQRQQRNIEDTRKRQRTLDDDTDHGRRQQ